MKNLVRALLAGAMVFAAGQAMAETKSANIQVKAVVEEGCAIDITDVNSKTLDFGRFVRSKLTSDIDAKVESGIKITCDAGMTKINVGLNRGLHADAKQRQLQGSAGGFLKYELFKDESRTQPWGDTGTETADLSDAATGGSSYEQQIYGRLLAVTDTNSITVGDYSDTVVMTVNYDMPAEETGE